MILDIYFQWSSQALVLFSDKIVSDFNFHFCMHCQLNFFRNTTFCVFYIGLFIYYVCLQDICDTFSKWVPPWLMVSIIFWWVGCLVGVTWFFYDLRQKRIFNFSWWQLQQIKAHGLIFLSLYLLLKFLNFTI